MSISTYRDESVAKEFASCLRMCGMVVEVRYCAITSVWVVNPVVVL